jgi:hypothetical protein
MHAMDLCSCQFVLMQDDYAAMQRSQHLGREAQAIFNECVMQAAATYQSKRGEGGFPWTDIHAY